MTPPDLQRRPSHHRIGAAEAVANELRAGILSGKYTSMLPKQDELREQFDISHPTLREALRILETEGLITVKRGNVGGSQVTRPDASTAAYHLGVALEATGVSTSDLATALLIIEPICARLCASRPDRATEVVPRLRELVEASAAAIDDAAQFESLARQFHHEITDLSGNASIRLVVSSIVALWQVQEDKWVERMHVHDEEPGPSTRRASLKAHRKLVQHIADGKETAAERTARQHLEDSRLFEILRYEDQTIDGTSSRALHSLRSFGLSV